MCCMYISTFLHIGICTWSHIHVHIHIHVQAGIYGTPPQDLPSWRFSILGSWKPFSIKFDSEYMVFPLLKDPPNADINNNEFRGFFGGWP